MSETRTEYALRIDCEANGCETPHSDDGDVLPIDPRTLTDASRINGHRVAHVRRTITVGEWEVDR